MPRFTITFEREVIQLDRCTRVIEAETIEAAREQAEEMASEFDGSCPDDAQQYGGDNCQSWYADTVAETPNAPLGEA